jgi:hypothetical protein
MSEENKQDRLTPEALIRIRDRFRRTLVKLDEIDEIEKQLGVRDPELEQLDAEIAERLARSLERRLADLRAKVEASGHVQAKEEDHER